MSRGLVVRSKPAAAEPPCYAGRMGEDPTRRRSAGRTSAEPGIARTSARGRGSRLDERMLADALVESRAKAQALILAGRVLVDDVPVEKAGTKVAPEAVVRIRGDLARFVSRGGEKLAGALDDLRVDPACLHCLDVGASTGGFTDCLLQRGAASVVAVDVGYGQLHPRLRSDPRVVVRERTHVRDLLAGDLALSPGTHIDLVVADCSFISLRLVLPEVVRVAPGAELLALVKPQFEVGRGRVGKGGVVREDALRDEAVEGVAEVAVGLGYEVAGRADSRLAGPKGNREIFLHLVPSTSG